MGTERAATVESLTALREANALTPAAYARALELSCASPGPQRWRAFLDWLLLGFGAALLLLGLVLLVAFNWAALPAFVKLGLVAALIAGAALGARHLTLDTTGGQVALTGAAVLVGPLLAIYGQSYQTGADPYQLFMGWAVLIAAWVASARFAPLLLIELVLVEVSLALFYAQVLDRSRWGVDEEALAACLAVLTLACWAALELAAHRGVEWLQARWFPRVLGLATLLMLGEASLEVIVGHASSEDWWKALSLVVLLALSTGAIFYFRLVRRDLFLVALHLAALLTVGTIVVGRAMFEAHLDLGAVFLLGLLVLGEAAWAAWWLRGLHRRWEGAS